MDLQLPTVEQSVELEDFAPFFVVVKALGPIELLAAFFAVLGVGPAVVAAAIPVVPVFQCKMTDDTLIRILMLI